MKNLSKNLLGLAIVVAFTSTSFAADKPFTAKNLNDESVLALSWVQNSAEFTALSYQAFNFAKLRWDMDKQDGKKAIVVDVDETIIDNSPYNGGLIGKDYGYSGDTWKAWSEDKSATALPGAVAFLNHVVETGGDVFYVTNRKSMPEKNMDLKPSTMENLKALGFPQIDDKHMMLRTSTSEKQERRDSITAMGYKIVLLMGDNLGDFDVAFEGSTMASRAKAVEDHKAIFGDKFIVLPNPTYGAWEAAVYGGGEWYKKSAQEKSELRKSTLRKFEFEK
ncbi:5'-nucleotidase, lipoprotein e(P4) family [Psychromonas sp. SP041]|uniref:5'-nucleotidase, lipoprotein e(P4) family n=1 Tax=Psychromonas sp. SP041 TaxID=1365007 RepID=UPI000410FF88|nr:5'-nucleotidase, lipoprotein e(P4) family [Psychromonas sp. SP041]